MGSDKADTAWTLLALLFCFVCGAIVGARWGSDTARDSAAEAYRLEANQARQEIRRLREVIRLSQGEDLGK